MQKISTKKVKFFFFLLLAVCILAAGTWLIRDVQEKNRAAREHAAATEAKPENTPAFIQETAELEIALSETETESETEPETEAYISPIDFEELWAVNEDVIGWIRIPDTHIDYPIFYGKDNEQYLHTDRNGNDSVAGEIYLDFEDAPDFSSLHNILYGHHMKNGTMFKDIVYYKEQDFFDQHRDIYIYTPEREIHLKAFACLYTSADGIRRRTRFYSGRALDDYVRKMTKEVVTKAKPEGPINKLYSLITCSYEFTNARTILYAYEVEE